MSVIDQLAPVFRIVFDDDTLQIAADNTANDIEGWDSLSHMNLILAVESNFNISFTRKEILSFRNIGDLAKCIEGKL